ncbi:hypothetical protein ACOMHN_019000 [Nucella lapillus]
MNTLIDNYPVLQVTLEEVAKGYDEYSRKASGLLSLMQNFSTMFGLQLSKQVFGATETLSNTLQHKQTSVWHSSKAFERTQLFVLSSRKSRKTLRMFVTSRAFAGTTDGSILTQRRTFAQNTSKSLTL